MSDPDPATTAITAATNAAQLWASKTLIGRDEIGYRQGMVVAALQAAAPLIETEARAAERQRIREVIDKHEAECICDSYALCSRLHTDLLEGDRDA